MSDQQNTLTESVRKHQIWVWPIIVALSVTAFVIGWVQNTRTLANKEIKIETIQHDNRNR